MSPKALTILSATVILIVLLAIALPGGITCGARPSNERNATTTLKTLYSAEMDFAGMDRDGNGVKDYWTGDVKGLYTMTSAAERGAIPGSTTDQSIKLLELSAACADADETFLPAGGENVPLASFGVPSTKAGYWYAAMKTDRSAGIAPDAEYRQDTKGTPAMGRVHHLTRFGFVALPDSSSAGKYVFIINEQNIVYRTPATLQWKTGSANPPGVSGIPSAYLNWPSDAELKANWTKID